MSVLHIHVLWRAHWIVAACLEWDFGFVHSNSNWIILGLTRKWWLRNWCLLGGLWGCVSLMFWWFACPSSLFFFALVLRIIPPLHPSPPRALLPSPPCSPPPLPSVAPFKSCHNMPISKSMNAQCYSNRIRRERKIKHTPHERPNTRHQIHKFRFNTRVCAVSAEGWFGDGVGPSDYVFC